MKRATEVVLIVLYPTVVKGDDTVIAFMEPLMKLLLLTDGKTGAILGKVYGYMLQFDKLFRGAR